MIKALKPLEVFERIKNAPTIYAGCASDIYTRYSFECKQIEQELTILKGLEDKLGVDLLTLFMALSNGIYFIGDRQEEPKAVQLRMFHEEPTLVHYSEDGTEEVYTAGYCKSWRLTKENYEKDN